MKKKFIIFLMIVLVIVAFRSYKISLSILKQREKPITKMKNEISLNINSGEQKDNTDFSVLPGTYDFTNEESVYTLMHYMINTKVTSDVIWGTLDLTKNRVKILINAVTVSNWNDKNKLLGILNRWENGDFSQAVDDHNYVWSRLGGKDGKATGIRK